MSDHIASPPPHVSGSRAVWRRSRWLLLVVAAPGVLSACGGSAVEDTADGLVVTSSGSVVGLWFWILAGAVSAITGVVLLLRLVRRGWRLRRPDRSSQKQAVVDGVHPDIFEAHLRSVGSWFPSVIGIIALFVLAGALWWYQPKVEVRVSLDRSAGQVTLTRDYLVRHDRTKQISVQDLVRVQVHYGQGNNQAFGRVILVSPDLRIEWDFPPSAAGELARAVARAAGVELVETGN